MRCCWRFSRGRRRHPPRTLQRACCSSARTWAEREGTGEKHALQEKTDPRVFEKLTDPTDEHPPATDEEAEMEAAEDAEHHHQELEEAEIEVEEREHGPH